MDVRDHVLVYRRVFSAYAQDFLTITNTHICNEKASTDYVPLKLGQNRTLLQHCYKCNKISIQRVQSYFVIKYLNVPDLKVFLVYTFFIPDNSIQNTLPSLVEQLRCLSMTKRIIDCQDYPDDVPRRGVGLATSFNST